MAIEHTTHEMNKTIDIHIRVGISSKFSGSIVAKIENKPCSGKEGLKCSEILFGS